jgi:hypothetical protein
VLHDSDQLFIVLSDLGETRRNLKTCVKSIAQTVQNKQSLNVHINEYVQCVASVEEPEDIHNNVC